jgi:predicted Rossmann fold flavoprotein
MMQNINNKHYEVIIIGAGAAGLMCAMQSAQRGRKTLLLEGANKVGKKIRISGGGRCNFTNLNITKDNFLSQNNAFAISALKRFTQDDFITLINKHKIAYHEKTLGQLFCDESAQLIIDMFLEECKNYQVEIITNNKIHEIKHKTANNQFDINSNSGDFTCNSLVIATGGLSIPKMGATDFGYKIAQQFALNIIPPTPALVPLTLPAEMLNELKLLSGVSIYTTVKLGSRIFSEGLLFTHRGLSGPAILQISSYWQKGQKISVNLLPKIDLLTYLKEQKQLKAKQDIQNLLNNLLPKRLVNYILSKNNIAGSLADLSHKKLNIIAQNINNWIIIPEDNEGFAKAEVTLGGVDCQEVCSKTFMAKKIPNLYFIGEILDVTGHLGGYNFQWAWSSGFACGQYV